MNASISNSYMTTEHKQVTQEDSVGQDNTLYNSQKRLKSQAGILQKQAIRK